MTTPIHFRSLHELARGLAAGEFSSLDLVDHFSQRIETLDSTLHALHLPLLDEARAQARAMDAERVAGNGPVSRPRPAARCSPSTAPTRMRP